MTTDAKTKKGSTKEAPAKAASRVRREEALAVASGLTEAERDLVASIVDWQLEGLDPADR